MAAVKLDKHLYTILLREDVDHFSVMDIRKAYFEEFIVDSDADRKVVRTWIYGQLRRLVKHQLLSKKKAANTSRAIYSKTPAFTRTCFKVNGKDISPEASNNSYDSCNITTQALKQLKDIAKEYRVELITSLGESEEYKRLLDTFPVLKPELEPRYHLARERSTKLLGRVKAVESVLEKMGSI